MIIDEINNRALRACYMLQSYKTQNGFAELLFNQEGDDLVIQSILDSKMVQVVIYNKPVPGGHLCGFGKKFIVRLYSKPPINGTATINSDSKTCLYRGTRMKKTLAHCIVNKATTEDVVKYTDFAARYKTMTARGQQSEVITSKSIGLVSSLFTGLRVRMCMDKVFCRSQGSSEVFAAWHNNQDFEIKFMEIVNQ